MRRNVPAINSNLGKLERDVASVAAERRTDLDQLNR